MEPSPKKYILESRKSKKLPVSASVDISSFSPYAHSKSSVLEGLSRPFPLTKQITVPIEGKKSPETRYLDFLSMTYRALLECNDLPLISMPELVQKQLTLPYYQKSEKTVFFDLDQTLVYSPDPSKVLVRPGAIQCLRSTSRSYEIGIFTSSCKEYADAIIDKLDPENKLVQHRLYREHCIKVGKCPIKDLRIIVNRKLENILIVDDSCLAFGYQIDNGIPILPWDGDSEDKELWLLADYLRELADTHNLAEANRRHFCLFSFCEDFQTRQVGKNRLKLSK